MRIRLARRMRRPSPGVLVALLALFVALGGTAYAATTTIVNIADSTTPANKAHVNSAGQLLTSSAVSGYVGQAIPRTPFVGSDFLSSTDEVQTVVAANKATVALTRLQFDNYFAQDNGAAIDVNLYEQGGNATTCDGSSGSVRIGRYDVQAGQTFSDAMQSPIVLKPLATGDVWCLDANLGVQGDPGSFYEPSIGFSGYVAAGTLPAGAIPAAKANAGVAPQARR
jgi:hypothetical protein